MAKQSVNVLTLGKTPLTTILKLAWPTIIEQMMFTVLNFSDTAMVGALGAVATAAVGITSTSIWLSGSVISAVSVGLSIQLAQSVGAGNYKRARELGRWRRINACLFLFALEPPCLAGGRRSGCSPCAGLSAGNRAFPFVQYAFFCIFFPASLYGRHSHPIKVQFHCYYTKRNFQLFIDLSLPGLNGIRLYLPHVWCWSRRCRCCLGNCAFFGRLGHTVVPFSL